MPTPMTVEGAEALREELTHLKKVVRPSIVKAISEAREHGDLRENAEYHAAKDQQGLTEARIRLIENRLGDAQIIDIVKIPPTGNVVFGATVTLVDLETDGEVRYKIVGEDEADLKENKISIMSPLARAMIGKAEGDTLVVETPQGNREYEVDTVRHI
ncbi:MAG: transcription elongation factor GreA [Gammaproteobacteria bacterium]|nr:transcription elongation factor GreA [Gammaproteobacteria bacterium]MXY57094.1 transcription elongation factor GreA [Gammaproteobacteria bacterium]MYF28240.1 transcription elongation factor GreA [Gammaproteobacteria bacterium]MYK45678.1 transcription elongation factor GreA [Gammaproteobacteria bacterium]